LSTKKKSTQKTQFDPGSKGVYDTLQPQIQNLLLQQMQDPYSFLRPQYDLALQMSLGQASRLGQRGMQNLLLNRPQMGAMSLQPYMASQIGRQSRATSGLQANAMLQNRLQMLQQGEGLRSQALGQSQGYNPLVTGQTATEKTSGLGTWLPQVIGAGLGFAGGFMPGREDGGGQAPGGGGGGGNPFANAFTRSWGSGFGQIGGWGNIPLGGSGWLYGQGAPYPGSPALSWGGR